MIRPPAAAAAPPTVPGLTLTYLGATRFALAERARATRLAQMGPEGYARYLTQCLQGDRAQVVAFARAQVATLTTRSEDWLTALCILYELHALPEPLVVTLAPGVTGLPLPEVPRSTR